MAAVQALDPTAIRTHQSHYLQVFKVNECSPTLGNNRQTSEEVMTSDCCVHPLDLWGETGSWILAVQCLPCWLLWIDAKLGALKAPLVSFLFKHKFNLWYGERLCTTEFHSDTDFFSKSPAEFSVQCWALAALLPCCTLSAAAGAVLRVQHQMCNMLGKARSSSHSFVSRTEPNKGKFCSPISFPFQQQVSDAMSLISTHSWPLLNCWEMFSGLQVLCHPPLSLLAAFSAPALGCWAAEPAVTLWSLDEVRGFLLPGWTKKWAEHADNLPQTGLTFVMSGIKNRFGLGGKVNSLPL